MLRINNKGLSSFSLIVGVMFLALVVAIVMRTVKKQNDNLKNILAETEIIDFTNNLKKQLSAPLNCTETFSGVSLNDGTVEKMIFFEQDDFLEKFEIHPLSGKTVGGQKLKVLEYRITTQATEQDQDTTGLGLATLVIKIDKNTDPKVKNITYHNIRLYVTSEDNTIISCAFGGLPQTNNLIVAKDNYTFIDTASIGVNTQETKAVVNIKGTMSIGNSNTNCNDSTKGMIQFNSQMRQFETCLTPPNWEKIHQ
ncbi:hypothetical protein [Halobacteriovorax sp. HLS]|uniref:hypothetical protein n=1 Tax=Halobacteriovorax sp. HLS TaxID=2234000 RepID=UPI000FD6CA85|nr:hypothetical protein [Halobacteriovorax sp. HLS]